MAAKGEEGRLLRLHAELLFDIDTEDRLVAVNEDGSEESVPRVFLVRGRSSSLIWFGTDVRQATVDAATRLVGRLPGWDGYPSPPATYEPLRALLAAEAPVVEETVGPAFSFQGAIRAAGDADVRAIDEGSAHLLEQHFPYTRWLLTSSRSPVVGAIADGAVVSACFSARRRPKACEAGVATEEPYRGQGLATKVVSAWRDAVEKEGRLPLYSTSWNNQASLAVARKLRLSAYAETLSLR